MTVATAEQEEQIEWLVRSFGPVIYKVAFAITRSRALAEEVVQDALFAAWSSMPSWEGDVPVRWLCRVTQNHYTSDLGDAQGVAVGGRRRLAVPGVA